MEFQDNEVFAFYISLFVVQHVYELFNFQKAKNPENHDYLKRGL